MVDDPATELVRVTARLSALDGPLTLTLPDAYRETLYRPLFEAQDQLRTRLAGLNRKAMLDGTALTKLEAEVDAKHKAGKK